MSKYIKGSGNVFIDLGFPPDEAAALQAAAVARLRKQQKEELRATGRRVRRLSETLHVNRRKKER